MEGKPGKRSRDPLRASTLSAVRDVYERTEIGGSARLSVGDVRSGACRSGDEYCSGDCGVKSWRGEIIQKLPILIVCSKLKRASRFSSGPCALERSETVMNIVRVFAAWGACEPQLSRSSPSSSCSPSLRALHDFPSRPRALVRACAPIRW